MLNFVRKHFQKLFFTTFILLWIFLFWKCRYGYGQTDESLYITIPYRILKGDNYLIHEWNLTQLSSIFVLPILKVYLLLFHNTTGIILHFRYIFTFIWGISALYIYFRLKTISKIGASLATLLYFIYTPFSIMALSYNSMGIMFLSTSLVTLISSKNNSAFLQIVAGILFACSILCCPYLLFVYIIYTLFVICNYFIKKDKTAYILRWKYNTLGTLIMFTIFCLIVITPITQNIELLNLTIPSMLNDPHIDISFLRQLYLYFYTIVFSTPLSPILIILSVIIIILSKFRSSLRHILFPAIIVLSIIMQLAFLFNTPYINLVMFAPNIIGIFCYINSKNKTIQRIFWWMLFPGLLYTFCINLSSDQYFYAISSASTVSSIASLVILTIYIKENYEEFNIKSSIAFIITILFLFIQLFSEIYLRYNTVFWEKSISTQNKMVEFGAEKGLLVTQEKLDYYTIIYSDMKSINNNPEINSVLFYSTQTIMYLDAEKEFGTYSPWLSGLGINTINRLLEYYSINPDKMPDVIYAPEDLNGLEVFTSLGYEVTYSDNNICTLIKEQ